MEVIVQTETPFKTQLSLVEVCVTTARKEGANLLPPQLTTSSHSFHH